MHTFTVIGIDVGAARKGYHAVALGGRGDPILFQSSSADDMATWCRVMNAQVVAIDAPCKWRAEGAEARTAERALAADRISCFSTPTLAKARGHSFYTWMFAGQELYSALAPDFPLYRGGKPEARVCFETYPQAVACAFAGTRVSAEAKTKMEIRRALLARAGIDPTRFASIDEIDAALCALTARRFAQNDFKAYGDAATGFIVVPLESLPPVKAEKPSRAFATVVRQLEKLSAEEKVRLRELL